MNKLRGKKALITGATRGIGMEISLTLLRKSVDAYLIGTNFDVLHDRITDLTDPQISYHAIKADLTKDSDIARITDEIGKNDMDILIHCAGVISVGPIESLDVDSFDWQYQVNVRAPYVLTQKLLPGIRKKKGDILFINSTAGLDSWGNISQYSASKHALKAVANSLRKEVVNDRVRISSLFVGSVNTSMQQYVQGKLGNANYDQEKFMNPEDVAQIILMLLEMPSGISITDLTIKPNI